MKQCYKVRVEKTFYDLTLEELNTLLKSVEDTSEMEYFVDDITRCTDDYGWPTGKYSVSLTFGVGGISDYDSLEHFFKEGYKNLKDAGPVV